MRVCVSLEERFVRTPDARVWSGGAGTAAYGFWKRYLDVFDHVQVVARVAEATSSPESTWKRADGEGVTFHALPCYVGPLQYAQRFLALSASIRSGLGGTDAVIMRVPSLIGLRLERTLSPDRPFGVEVVGDVYEALAPGSIEHPLRPLLRWWLTRQLKRQCQKACAASYVTKETVQRRYP